MLPTGVGLRLFALLAQFSLDVRHNACGSFNVLGACCLVEGF